MAGVIVGWMGSISLSSAVGEACAASSAVVGASVGVVGKADELVVGGGSSDVEVCSAGSAEVETASEVEMVDLALLVAEAEEASVDVGDGSASLFSCLLLNADSLATTPSTQCDAHSNAVKTWRMCILGFVARRARVEYSRYRCSPGEERFAL